MNARNGVFQPIDPYGDGVAFQLRRKIWSLSRYVSTGWRGVVALLLAMISMALLGTLLIEI